MDIEFLTKALMFFGALFIVGIGSLMSVRKLDRTNYIIQKVTPLSLHRVNEHDDVWLKGVAECDAPLSLPYFGHACLFYDHLIEEDVNIGKKKKPSWRRVEKSSNGAAFFLRDGEHKIRVDGNDAEFKDLVEDYKYEGPLRHTLKYFPLPSELNVVGSVSEGKESLEKRANIPLIVTTKNRENYVRRAEFTELKKRVLGLFASWAGATGVLVTLSSTLPMLGIDPKGALTLAVAAPAFVFALYWAVSKYNTFVIYRNRIDNAWRQVDVDLSMRYELIPKLVESAKGFMKHERELLERLGGLRNLALTSREKKLFSEGEAATSVQQTVARIEEYSDLKTQGTVYEVTQQMHAIEEKIAHGRQIYNGAVREYNDNVEAFPQVVIARLFGFREHTFFSIPEEKAQMAEIKR